MVNWNRKELLRACLTSLALQKNVDFETIVVDNGSSDGTTLYTAIGNGSTNPNANPPDLSESIVRLSLDDPGSHQTPAPQNRARPQ